MACVKAPYLQYVRGQVIYNNYETCLVSCVTTRHFVLTHVVMMSFHKDVTFRI